MSRKKPICVYNPQMFDPDSILPNDLKDHCDSARWILHRIVWGKMMKKASEDGFVSLKYDYLTEIIPRKVLRPLLDVLIKDGAIECDNHFIRGYKSFGYRLSERYFKDQIVRVELCNKQTAEKIKVNRRAEYKKVRLDVHCHLRNQLKKLTIDLPYALSLIKGHHEFEMVKIPAMQIAERDFDFKVCRYGRIHTDVTRCHSKMRNAMLLNGEPLVSVDIKNSQPLFLGLLIINYRKHGNKLLSCVSFKHCVNPYKGIDHIITKTITPFSSNINNTTSSHLSSRSITTVNIEEDKTQRQNIQQVTDNSICPRQQLIINKVLAPDEAHFITLCEQGRLYENLMEHAEIPVRTWAKEVLFEIMYGQNRTRSKNKTSFNEMFPSVAKVVRTLKRKDYCFLSRLLQNIESNFVINTVCRRLMSEHSEIPLITIHDSILTTPAHAETVQDIFMQEFQCLGLNPSFHVTQYGKDELVTD